MWLRRFGGQAFALTCILSSGVVPAKAGAWLQPAGSGQAIMSGTYTASRNGFDASGRRKDIADYRKFEFDAFVEYGLTDAWTLVAQPQLRSVSIGSPDDARHTGLGYTDFGARVLLWESGRSVVSGQALVRIPGSGDADDPAQAGSTEAEVDLRLLYGRSFDLGPWSSFFDAEAAYRARLGGLEDQFRFDLTLGTRPRPDILVMAQSFNTFAAKVSRNPPNEDREHKVEVSVVWDATPALSLQLGAIATIAGRSTLAERGVVAALWWRF